MSFAASYAAQAYAKVGMETGAASADPHQLILMLFEGAIAAVIDGRRHMQAGNVARKCESLSKAVMIMQEGLVASLDPRAGGPLAQNLSALYEYMARRLLLANAKNDPAVLDEVQRLLGELKSAWAAIPPQQRQSSTQPRSQNPATARPY